MRSKIIEGLDGRPKWLEWRHAGIGSSDASVIMDVSRFKSREELREEKSKSFTGEDQANSYIKERGNRIEVLVRSILEDKHQTGYPATNFECVDFNFMRASLDGYSQSTKVGIEIKLLSVFNPTKPNTETAGYKKWQEAQKGIIPEEYVPQVQHQLMVTGAEKLFFVGLKDVKGQDILKDNLAIVECFPDKAYQDRLFLEECKFWRQVSERR